MRLRLAAADEDVDVVAAEVDRVVLAGCGLDGDRRLSGLLQVEDVEQVGDRIALGQGVSGLTRWTLVRHLAVRVPSTAASRHVALAMMSGMPNRPYYVDVPLRWSDMDALRHVNNVQIVRLLEEARVAALREWFRDSEGSRTARPC
ncbi:acyl-CoA thioesterase [Barrientosiimonas endolithica]|uniref:acyl-CoA thioesterase n=1 Tax=Barrientosiimonas endolithica TaxID=1535208 RepID=UPI00259BB016|nr:hypothetical protein [Barrientosiimonas endolithica]